MRYCDIKNKKIGQGRPVVCVPLVGKTDTDVLKQLDAVLEKTKETTIDMVEFRGDFYENLGEVEKLTAILNKVSERLSEKDIVLLFTIRSDKEGGEQLSFTKPSIYDINAYIIENKLADMVDVELFIGDGQAEKLVSLAKTKDVKIIMSNHDFDTTPAKEEIVGRLVKMQEMGTDIAKIAVMPENMFHVFTLLEATYEMKLNHNDTPVVTMSMGKMGAISRITGEIFGSAVTFATVGEASAPGQIPAEELDVVMNIIDKYCV